MGRSVLVSQELFLFCHQVGGCNKNYYSLSFPMEEDKSLISHILPWDKVCETINSTVLGNYAKLKGAIEANLQTNSGYIYQIQWQQGPTIHIKTLCICCLGMLITLFVQIKCQLFPSANEMSLSLKKRKWASTVCFHSSVRKAVITECTHCILTCW